MRWMKKASEGECRGEGRVIPVDAVGLLEGETEFLGIEGESRACVEVFLITADCSVQRPCCGEVVRQTCLLSPRELATPMTLEPLRGIRAVPSRA